MKFNKPLKNHTYGYANKILALLLTTGALLLSSSSVYSQQPKQEIDLVITIVVDMLKGETPFQHYDRLNGGIKYLIDNGVSYTNAHYQHSTTFTAVGHAVFATGAPAAEHGLAGNDWANRVTGERIYCVADPESKHLMESSIKGTSPKNLTTTTIADEIVLSSGSKSRTYGVSIKDRGSILPAGRLGKAFYYDPPTGDFITSTYYYSEMPKWLVEFNKAGHKDQYRGKQWNLLYPKETYTFAHNDKRTGEKGYYELGPTFPKKYDAKDDKSYYGGLRFAPGGDELTLELAKHIVTVEKLGQQGQTDVLTISLSAQDYIGHAWGTHSLEYEDHFLHVDKMLGEFFKFIDKKIGLNKTLIVLSADHGSDDVPEYQKEKGLDAGRHYPDKFIQAANEALKKQYGIKEDLIMAFWNPSLFLNPQVMEKNKLSYPDVEVSLAKIMVSQEGFKYAVARSDIELGHVPNTPIMNKLLRAFHSERSGNVLMIQDQFWYLYPNADQFAAMHGSPYAYDTHVPIVVAGPGIKQKIVHRSVTVSDIVPTIAKYMNVRMPAGADGNPLVEVFNP